MHAFGVGGRASPVSIASQPENTSRLDTRESLKGEAGAVSLILPNYAVVSAERLKKGQ